MVTYPDNGQVAYEYDAGALKKVWNPSAPNGYYAFYSGFTALGQVGRVDYGNGASTTYGYYEKSDRLQSLYTTGQGDLQNFEYQYDKVGNITRIRDLNNCSQGQAMAYDDLNRLTLWQRVCGGTVGEEIVFTYFKDGNIRLNSRVDPVNEYLLRGLNHGGTLRHCRSLENDLLIRIGQQGYFWAIIIAGSVLIPI